MRRSSPKGDGPLAGVSPKLLHVVPSDGWGGVETAARAAAEAPLLSCDLTVLFLAGRTLAKDRSRIIDHPARTLNRFGTYAASIAEILRHDPDILVCSLWRSVAVGIAVKACRPGMRLVFFLHSEIPAHLPDRIVDAVGMRVADEIWADSTATLQNRARGRGKQGRVISFVTRRFEPLCPPLPAPRFVSWSRLHRQKGHDRSIRVIAALAARGIDARLEIWGVDNGEGPSLSDLSKSLGVLDLVSFPGLIEHARIPELASRHAFYFQLSRYEGMAMAVVEAMQCGLVPVVTPVGQMAAYVRDGVNGLVADPSDPDRTAQAILEILAEPGRFPEVSHAAMETWKEAPLYSDDLCRAAEALWALRKEPSAD